MASIRQRKGACGHIMASFDKHSHCARCRDKGMGDDPCIRKLPCEYCELLTLEQVIQLATPTYKLRKEKQESKDSLVDPASVTVLSQVEPQDMDPAVSSHNSSTDLSLPQPSFCKELQDLDDKWSVRMVRLKALLAIGQRPASQPSFFPVKAPVVHKSPAGALSQSPFLISTVPSGQASPASGPDRTQNTTTSSLDMIPPMENLYQETDPELVFAQPVSAGPVSATYEHSVDPLPIPITPPDQVEEGELSELEDQSQQDISDSDHAISEDQNYHETLNLLLCKHNIFPTMRNSVR